jgi:hypothetical protein
LDFFLKYITAFWGFYYGVFYLQTPHVPPFLAQYLQNLQFLQALQFFEPVHFIAAV